VLSRITATDEAGLNELFGRGAHLLRRETFLPSNRADFDRRISKQRQPKTLGVAGEAEGFEDPVVVLRFPPIRGQ
jgi:hypothetical protein